MFGSRDQNRVGRSQSKENEVAVASDRTVQPNIFYQWRIHG